MIPRILTGFALLGTLVIPSIAAPATFHQDEFSVPLENLSALALIDAPTGQLRIISFETGLAGVLAGPFQSHLADTTGVSGGIYDEKGVEHLALTSTTENAVRLFRLDGSPPEPVDIPLTQPGPANAVPLHGPEDETTLLVHATLADGGHGLSLLGKLFSNPSEVNAEGPLDFSQSLQTHQSLDGERQALIIEKDTLQLIRSESESLERSTLTPTFDNGRIASEVVGEDGRHCALIYEAGSSKVQVVTLAEDGFSLEVNETLFSTTIASISSIPTSNGALILANDGLTAYEVRVNDGAELEVITSVTAPAGLRMNHLSLLPSVGLIALQGPATGGPSDRFRRYTRSGDSWAPANGSPLPSLIDPTNDFATLFWFNASPLVDPTSQLLKLETQPQWTRKTTDVPLPAAIELSAFANSSLGLEVTGTTPTSAPAGATHLLTNQIGPDLSLSALDSTQALRRPNLSVSPPSGSYANPIQLDANFDANAVEVLMRRDFTGDSWQPFSPLTISYPGTCLFYARDLQSQVTGPIVTRTFSFPSLDVNDLDTDRDGVPDYVEIARGLDPAAGADTDGDFQSDLEELLAGTDPANPNSRETNPADRRPPFIGEGFSLVAQAYDDTSFPQEAAVASGNPLSGGTTLTLYDFQGDLLAAGLVEDFTLSRIETLGLPASYLNQVGALLNVTSPVPESDWIVMTTPTHWRFEGSSGDLQEGQEILRVMARPINDVPTISHTPLGNNLDQDANDWIAAAQLAYTNHEPFGGITPIVPLDLVVSVLAEEALYRALTAVQPQPFTRQDFTLFPFRESDGAREPFTTEMKDTLQANGFDFPEVIAFIESEVQASSELESLARDLVTQYRLEKETSPLLLSPLAALRDILATGSISDPRGNGRPNPYQGLIEASLQAASDEMTSILNQLGGLTRPTATYELTVENPSTPSNDPQFRITSAANPAQLNTLLWATDQFGDRFSFDQGLGLSTGTTFTVSGFTDAPAPAGFVGLEVTSITAATIFIASENDTDGDLLDDQWEEVFFGGLDQVTAFETHPISGHSYLEYQLTGEDPRSGTLSGPPASLLPTNVTLSETSDGNAFLISFDFPGEYRAFFNFELQVSETLQGFNSSNTNESLQTLSPNRFSFRTNTADTGKEKVFWRIAMSLAE